MYVCYGHDSVQASFGGTYTISCIQPRPQAYIVTWQRQMEKEVPSLPQSSCRTNVWHRSETRSSSSLRLVHQSACSSLVKTRMLRSTKTRSCRHHLGIHLKNSNGCRPGRWRIRRTGLSSSTVESSRSKYDGSRCD